MIRALSVPRFVRRLSVLVSLVVLAACGSAGASPSVSNTAAGSPGASGAASGGSGAPVTTAGNSGSGGGNVAQACTLLSDEDLVEVTGWGRAEARAGSTQGLFDNGCVWTLDGGSSQGIPATITLGILAPGGRAYYDTYFAPFAAENGDEPLEGLGDVGLLQDDGNVMVVDGDVLVSLFWLDALEDEPEKPVELVKRVLENLGG